MAAVLTITGNTNNAEAAIARLERRWDAMEQKIKASGQSSRDSNKSWGDSLEVVAGRYAGIAAAAGLVTAAVSGTISKNKEFLAQLDEMIRKQSELDAKLGAQTGLSKEQITALRPGMEAALLQTPSASAQDASKIMAQIASSGIKEADVKSGAALQAVLDIKAATGQFGENIGDPGQAAKTLAKLVKGSGNANPAAADLERMGASMVSLFQASDVQMPDFEMLAPKMSSLKNFGLSDEQALGAFAALTEVSSPEKGATGLSAFVTRTAAAGASNERVKALAELGLAPEDVAMAKGGKGFDETVELLRTKFGEKSQEDRNRLLTELYGEEGQAAAAELLSDSGRQRTQSFVRAAGDRDPFNKNVAAFRESRYARDYKMGLESEFATMANDTGTTWDEFNKGRAADLAQRNKGAPWYERMNNNYGDWVEGAMMGIPQAAGMTPEESGWMGQDRRPDVERRIAEKIAAAGLQDETSLKIKNLEAEGNRTAEQFRATTDPETREFFRSQMAATREQIDILKRDRQRPLNPSGNVE